MATLNTDFEIAHLDAFETNVHAQLHTYLNLFHASPMMQHFHLILKCLIYEKLSIKIGDHMYPKSLPFWLEFLESLKFRQKTVFFPIWMTTCLQYDMDN